MYFDITYHLIQLFAFKNEYSPLPLCHMSVVPASDQQLPSIEKTPEAILPAPTIPGVAENLIVKKVPLAPRALCFTDISPDTDAVEKGNRLTQHSFFQNPYLTSSVLD